MNKLDQNARNKLHFWWFIITVVCVFITYYYQKSKAAHNYKKVLQTAAESCSYEVIESLMENIVYIDETGISDLTFLGYASRSGCLQVVKFLVNKGANINFTSKYGGTALHDAAHAGHIEIVRFLLEKGANPSIRDTDGKTPRKVAVLRSRHNKDKPYDEIIKLLANTEDKFQAK